MDLRVRRTKHAIRTAFVYLLSENTNITAITVTDICKHAKINRKTFYNNYRDLYDLLDELENEIVKGFVDIISEYSAEYFLDHPQTFFNALTKTIDQNYELYSKIILINHTDGLISKIKTTIIRNLKEYLLESDYFDITVLDFITTYTISGIISVYHEVFAGNIDLEPEELSLYIEKIVMTGVESFVRVNN